MNWTDEELEKFFVFCILCEIIPNKDRFFKVFNSLIDKCWRGTFFKSFHLNSKKKMLEILDVDVTEIFLKNNWIRAIDLRYWSRHDLIRMAEGIGVKSADLFVSTREGKNENY